MAGTATKAASSVYYKARMAAHSCNDRYGCRDSAAECLGIDRTRLARMELGTTTPYPEEILMMADAYNAPELMNYFCTHECPIGKRMVPQAEIIQLDRLTIKILNAVDGVKDIGADMGMIAGNGRVTKEEMPKLQEILDALKSVSKVAAEMQIWMQKYAFPSPYGD